jgi:hypothetical protein
MKIIIKGLEERLRAQNKTRGTVKLKSEKLSSHTDKNGICYHIGGIFIFYEKIDRSTSIILDHIYLETNKSNEPYSIACILDFRLVS